MNLYPQHLSSLIHAHCSWFENSAVSHPRVYIYTYTPFRYYRCCVCVCAWAAIPGVGVRQETLDSSSPGVYMYVRIYLDGFSSPKQIPRCASLPPLYALWWSIAWLPIFRVCNSLSLSIYPVCAKSLALVDSWLQWPDACFVALAHSLIL